VIQLTRLGDTLQSLMALRAAKQLYPELEIHFVAQERFASAAKKVPWIKNVITLPTEKLLDPILEGKRSESEALPEIAKWLAPLADQAGQPWDFLINWSFSESSSFLTGLIPARVKLGYSRQKDTSFSSTDGWSNYIQAIIQGGSTQNIHLTDILTTQILTALQIHIGDPLDEGNTPVTSKTFFSLDPEIRETRGTAWGDLSRKWIGIQLGASRKEKTWDPRRWAQLAEFILRRNPEYNLVFLGGTEDIERYRTFQATLGDAFRKKPLPDYEKRILSLVGATDFDLWASVVSRCQWVFAGDTAVIHLASVLGTRVMNISVGPVRWLETGPYGNGHYVISAHGTCAACLERSDSSGIHSCGSNISPEAVYGAWSYAILERSHHRKQSLMKHFAEHDWTEHTHSVQIHRSKIRNTQEGGGVCYESLVPRPFRIEDWSAMVMGHIARSWYCGWVPPVGQELTRGVLHPEFLKKLRELEESSGVLLKVCEEAKKTALTLRLRSGNLRSEKIMRLSDRDEIKALGIKLMELDTLMERLGKTHPPLLAFSQMSKVLMHNLKSTHLSELGKESAECYRLLGDGIKILRDWIQATLDLAKPVAVVAAHPGRQREHDDKGSNP
jgi:ADP-heptose:LPS heptosyltransferase